MIGGLIFLGVFGAVVVWLIYSVGIFKRVCRDCYDNYERNLTKREDKKMSYAHKVFEKDGVRVVKTSEKLIVEKYKEGQGWLKESKQDSFVFLITNFPITTKTILRDSGGYVYTYDPSQKKMMVNVRTKDALGAPSMEETDGGLGLVDVMNEYYYTIF